MPGAAKDAYAVATATSSMTMSAPCWHLKSYIASADNVVFMRLSMLFESITCFHLLLLDPAWFGMHVVDHVLGKLIRYFAINKA